MIFFFKLAMPTVGKIFVHAIVGNIGTVGKKTATYRWKRWHRRQENCDLSLEMLTP